MPGSKTEKYRRSLEAAKLEKIAAVLKAISHPYRLEILDLLQKKEPQSVADLLRQIDIEQSLLSHHLTKMKDKGVLESFRKGRNIFYRLSFREITKIFDCMEQCDIF